MADHLNELAAFLTRGAAERERAEAGGGVLMEMIRLEGKSLLESRPWAAWPETLRRPSSLRLAARPRLEP